ncbi:hypothetical protein [Terasakiella pusilla]|uniref:hypothetical protein n=1 Tax=Terasakiella pusilla TaxID=64973 RepID=UPI00048F985D|nr:hypothetical protein [Terasakiella pusilla]
MTMKILGAALLAATLTLGVTQDAAAQQKSNPFKTGGDLAHACAYYRADPSALTPLQLIQKTSAFQRISRLITRGWQICI